MKKKVLIVEHDLFWRAMVQQNLDSLHLPIDAHFFSSSDEALAFVQKNNGCDLIIADAGLPGSMNGVALWKTVVRDHPGTPFVLISDKDEAEFIDDSVDVPMFVSKKDLHLNLRNGLIERLTNLSHGEVELDSVVVPSKPRGKSMTGGKKASRKLSSRELILILVLVVVAAIAYLLPKSPMIEAGHKTDQVSH